jgi:hypothetical protein
MKMTRNRKYGSRLALAALLVSGLGAGLPAAPVLAQTAGGESVTIELNKLEPQDDACRAYLVVKNGSSESFDSLKLDLVIFDSGGVVAKRLAVQAAPLPVGKTSLKVFDIQGHDCASVGSILLNDVLACEPTPPDGTDCLSLIGVSARGELSFMK